MNEYQKRCNWTVSVRNLLNPGVQKTSILSLSVLHISSHGSQGSSNVKQKDWGKGHKFSHHETSIYQVQFHDGYNFIRNLDCATTEYTIYYDYVGCVLLLSTKRVMSMHLFQGRKII